MLKSRAPDWITHAFEYTRLTGARVRIDGYAGLTHFFKHQTHHRAQAGTLLKQAGIDPGDTDIVAMPAIQSP